SALVHPWAYPTSPLTPPPAPAPHPCPPAPLLRDGRACPQARTIRVRARHRAQRAHRARSRARNRRISRLLPQCAHQRDLLSCRAPPPSAPAEEHAMMLMLMVSRRVISQHANVSGGRWRGNGPAPRMYEIHGKTLGIIGLGTIGKKVARLARAFGMRVQYYDIVRMTEDAEDARGVRFRLMGELLAISDIVTLHVPLNTTTRHMIGAHELASMKPEAIIVNTSRGPVIDEAALARALEAIKLFGAGLVVFDQEPPPPDNPLLALKNVVLTSHFAGPTWDNQIARLRNAYDNVQRVARGEPPLWVVPELSDLVM